MSPWTLEVDLRLRELLDAGHKHPEIARILNQEFDLTLSANACIGRANRLAKRELTGPSEPKRKGAPIRAVPFPKVFADRPRPRPGEIGIEDLTSNTCRWPNGEGPPYSYCGKPPVDGGPYCDHHANLAYPGYTRKTA